MRSFIFLAFVVGLVLVVGWELNLSHMDFPSPYAPTPNHKGDEGWPIIPAAVILVFAVAGAIANIKRKQSSIDKKMYDERNVVPNESNGPHSGLGRRSIQARRKNFQYPA